MSCSSSPENTKSDNTIVASNPDNSQSLDELVLAYSVDTLETNHKTKIIEKDTFSNGIIRIGMKVTNHGKYSSVEYPNPFPLSVLWVNLQRMDSIIFQKTDTALIGFDRFNLHPRSIIYLDSTDDLALLSYDITNEENLIRNYIVITNQNLLLRFDQRWFYDNMNISKKYYESHYDNLFNDIPMNYSVKIKKELAKDDSTLVALNELYWKNS